MTKPEPSIVFLAKVFKELHLKQTKELSKIGIHDGKYNWITGVATEVINVINDRIRLYNSNAIDRIRLDDILQLFEKIKILYGLELKSKQKM